MLELLEHGFEVTLTSVSADGIGSEWLGTKLDLNALDRLRGLAADFRFNIDGEGGEFETAVSSAPWMVGRIELEGSHYSSGCRHWLEIESSEVV